jgi:hypothetical protein
MVSTMAGGDAVSGLLGQLLDEWEPARIRRPPPAETPVTTPRQSRAITHSKSLAEDLGAQLIAEVLDGVKAGRQGIMITTPDKLRTAIFVRGYSLQEFARLARIAPSTLSRALAGQPVAPLTWKRIIITLATLE